MKSNGTDAKFAGCENGVETGKVISTRVSMICKGIFIRFKCVTKRTHMFYKDHFPSSMPYKVWV